MKKVNFKKWSFFSFQGCLVLFILLGSVKLQAQTIRYVRTSARGTGDGSSWANASGNLQAMINASAVGDTVWVGAGTYKPTQDLFGNSLPLNPRSLTFYIKDGVNLYGGFAGTETNLSQRNITINKTTLSGEIGNIDYYDNCFHVVVASASSSGGIGVTIDGFTIKSGFCDGNGAVMVNGNSISNNSGAGVYIVNGTNKLSNNNVSSNESKFGGSTGIRIVNGTNTLTGNTVSGNSARFGSGGGIGLFNGTNMLINNTISNNSAYPGFGAGILASYCTNTFINNVVSGNNVQDGSGAGIRTSQCTNILIDNEFSYNNADYGAGFDSDGCINTLIGNTFSNNFSGFLVGGAGMYLVGSTSTVVNNVLYDNEANKGAGIYTEGGSSTVINNTFWRNDANSGSGGIYTSGGINTLTNNIFWENTKGGSAYTEGADIEGTISSILTVKFCLTQSFGVNGVDGNIVGQDPLFTNPTIFDFTLQDISPCVHTGDDATWVTTGLTTDAAGNIRPFGVIDMGAFENQSVENIITFCESDINLPNDTLFDYTIYKAENTITTQQVLSQSTNAIYKASHSITLKAGFHAPVGATLSASIEQIICDNLVAPTVEKRTIKNITTKAVLKAVQIYPNPSNHELTVTLESSVSERANFRILNLSGQLLSQKEITLLEGWNVNALDIFHLTAGTYILQVQSETGIQQSKFVKL